MWKVEYKKRFLKELSKLPEGVQAQAEKVVFEALLCEAQMKQLNLHPADFHGSDWNYTIKPSMRYRSFID